MLRLLVYIMTSDTGKAPKIKNGICILKGCKKNTIEKHAEIGEWVIGIGSKKMCNGKYDRKMIYAMKVEEKKPPSSSHFTHYGNKAIFVGILENILKTRFRTKYINDPKLYQKFDKFMGREPKGKIDSYCCKMPCKH